MRIAIVAVLLFSVMGIVGAEESPAPIGPGAELLDGSILKPFTATYRMSRGGEPWATAVVDLRPASVEGAEALRHSYSMYFTGQTVYDETLFRKDTLAPLVKFIHGGMPPELAYKVYAYQGDTIRGSTVFADGKEPASLEQSFDAAPFGAGTDYLVAAALPLEKGFAATLLSADDSGLHPGDLRVTGRGKGEARRSYVGRLDRRDAGRTGKALDRPRSALHDQARGAGRGNRLGARGAGAGARSGPLGPGARRITARRSKTRAMKQTIALAAALFAGILIAGEEPDLEVVHRIKQEAFKRSQVMELVFRMTDVHGPRLTNSPGMDAAAAWAVEQAKEWGLDNAKLESWEPFGRGWSTSRFSAHLIEPQYAPLIGVPLAWTPGTDGKVVGTPVLAPLQKKDDHEDRVAELERYKEQWRGKLRDKIVMVGEPLRRGACDEAHVGSALEVRARQARAGARPRRADRDRPGRHPLSRQRLRA